MQGNDSNDDVDDAHDEDDDDGRIIGTHSGK